MEKFGRLTVLGETRIATPTRTVAGWICRCDCGVVKTFYAGMVKTGRAKSCGCIQNKGTLQDRFDRSYEPVPETGCWIWTGDITGDKQGTKQPYGRMKADLNGENRSWLAHRASWVLANGPIPDGLFVCHKCDVTLCVNPDHLFLGTHTDNMRDMAQKNRRAHNYLVGEAARNSKLTESQVKAIRQDTRVSGVVASEYGVSSSTIRYVRLGIRWNHVK